jgi:hypothetical protein
MMFTHPDDVKKELSFCSVLFSRGLNHNFLCDWMDGFCNATPDETLIFLPHHFLLLSFSLRSPVMTVVVVYHKL